MAGKDTAGMFKDLTAQEFANLQAVIQHAADVNTWADSDDKGMVAEILTLAFRLNVSPAIRCGELYDDDLNKFLDDPRGYFASLSGLRWRPVGANRG